MWVQVRQKLQLKLTGSSDANETHLKIPQGSWNLTPLGFLALALLFFFGGGPVRCGVRPPGRIRKARLVFPGPLQYHPTGTPLAPNSRTSRTFCRLIIDGYHTTITWYYAWCEPTTFISGLSVRCVYKICSFLKNMFVFQRCPVSKFDGGNFYILGMRLLLESLKDFASFSDALGWCLFSILGCFGKPKLIGFQWFPSKRSRDSMWLGLRTDPRRPGNGPPVWQARHLKRRI